MFKLVSATALGLLMLNTGAMAACTVPNTLTNGTPADATAVMGNFTSLAACATPLTSPSFTGNVSINTSGAGPALDIQDSSATSSIRIKSGSNGAGLNLDRFANSGLYSSQVSFITAGASDFAMGTSQGAASSDSFSIYSYGIPGNVFTILKSSGYVGVGTVSPSYLLHVNGTAYASGAAGALSDRRHKKDIEPLAVHALSLISRLKPVTFNWKEPKDDGMEGRQMGFIAQDVQAVLPETILTMKDQQKTLGLKYNEFIPLLTKAIQQQQTQIASLKAENRAQRVRLDNVRARGDAELLQLRSEVNKLQHQGVKIVSNQ